MQEHFRILNIEKYALLFLHCWTPYVLAEGVQQQQVQGVP